jgi:hypothetical protein
VTGRYVRIARHRSTVPETAGGAVSCVMRLLAMPILMAGRAYQGPGLTWPPTRSDSSTSRRQGPRGTGRRSASVRAGLRSSQGASPGAAAGEGSRSYREHTR